nr:phage tail protein [Aeromonas tecta]
MGDSGEALPLIQGDGMMRGSFVIEGISTTRTEFFDDGAARKIEFNIKLKRVDDNDTTFGNTLLNRTAGKLLGSIGNKLGGFSDGPIRPVLQSPGREFRHQQPARCPAPRSSGTGLPGAGRWQ